MIEIDNLDGSFSIVSEGCDSSFLDKLSVHLAYNKKFFSKNELELNNTLEQLLDIEKLIVAHRKLAEWHTRDFYQGLVAYCGELLRHKIPGKWGMIESVPYRNYPKTRYFPIIVDNKGQSYSFSASIEVELAYLLDPNLKWDKMDGLYYAVLFRSLSPDLPHMKGGDLLLPF